MGSNSWGLEATHRFPDLLDRLAGITAMYSLWNELSKIFKEAYGPPKNPDLISRIYAFARWCGDQPRGKTAEDDLLTCVSVCFLEEIPTMEAAIEDMPSWFTRAEVLNMKDTFSYHVGEVRFLKIIAAYDRLPKKQRKHGQRA